MLRKLVNIFGWQIDLSSVFKKNLLKMADMVFFFGSLVEQSALNPLDNSNRHLLFPNKS